MKNKFLKPFLATIAIGFGVAVMANTFQEHKDIIYNFVLGAFAMATFSLWSYIQDQE